MNNNMCKWERYNDKYGNTYYETSCRSDIDSDELSPISNGFVYCPYCSLKIEFILETTDGVEILRIE